MTIIPPFHLLPSNSNAGHLSPNLRRQIIRGYGRNYRLVAAHNSPTFGGLLLVVDAPGAIRYLCSIGRDGRILSQSAVDRLHRQRLIFLHERLLAFPFTHKTQSALLLGLGGGDLVRHIAHHFSNCALTIVEKDPLVELLARRYFFIRQPILTGDALVYLASAARTYDVIVVDLYDGGGLFRDTPSLWKRAIASLNPRGWLAVNWAEFSGNQEIRCRAERLATLAMTNIYLKAASESDNLIQLVSPSRMIVDDAKRQLRSGSDPLRTSDPLNNCYFDTSYPA